MQGKSAQNGELLHKSTGSLGQGMEHHWLRVDEPHDRRDGDLANDESQLNASDAEAALFLFECLFTSENIANRAPVHVHKTCFNMRDLEKKKTLRGKTFLFMYAGHT